MEFHTRHLCINEICLCICQYVILCSISESEKEAESFCRHQRQKLYLTRINGLLLLQISTLLQWVEFYVRHLHVSEICLCVCHSVCNLWIREAFLPDTARLKAFLGVKDRNYIYQNEQFASLSLFFTGDNSGLPRTSCARKFSSLNNNSRTLYQWTLFPTS